MRSAQKHPIPAKEATFSIYSETLVRVSNGINIRVISAGINYIAKECKFCLRKLGLFLTKEGSGTDFCLHTDHVVAC